VESDDGESGIFGADLFDVMEALEIPGMDVNEKGLPTADGERTEKVGEGIETLNIQGCVRSVQKSLRKSGPR